jgi:hypothetical protein
VPFDPSAVYQDDEGSVLVEAKTGQIALLDDRDLERYADRADELPRVRKAEVPERFGFVRDPAVSLHRP